MFECTPGVLGLGTSSAFVKSTLKLNLYPSEWQILSCELPHTECSNTCYIEWRLCQFLHEPRQTLTVLSFIHCAETAYFWISIYMLVSTMHYKPILSILSRSLDECLTMAEHCFTTVLGNLQAWAWKEMIINSILYGNIHAFCNCTVHTWTYLLIQINKCSRLTIGTWNV